MTSLARILPCVLLAASLTGSLHAQTPKPAPTAREEEYVTEKGFSNRVFELRHRNPDDLIGVVRPLSSGARGAAMSANVEFRTISMRDFPENIASVESALKRLDVAPSARADVELRLWVLVGSNVPTSSNRFPEDLKGAVEALKSTLTYKSYALAGTFVQRVREGARNIRGEGVTDLSEAGEAKPWKPMQLEYQINGLSLVPDEKGSATLRLDGFGLSLVGDGRAQLHTDVTLHDGEKVVVGTSTVRDRALVVVLSGRVVSNAAAGPR